MYSEPNLAILNFLFSVLGLLVSGSVLLCFLLHHRGRLNLKDKLGPFILVLFTFLWPLVMGFCYITIIVNGRFTYFWTQYYGVSVMCFVGGTLTGHILLTLERYYIVLYNEKLTTAKVVACFCIIYGYLFVSLVIKLGFAPYGFVPMESGFWCFVDFISSHPTQRANNILIILFCIGAVCFISFAYFSVYYKTREVVKMRRKPSAHRTMTALEKRVFHRCLLIATSFIITYSPTFLGFFYRFFTGNYISPGLDYATATWSLLDNIITPVLVCYMQSDFRDAVLTYLPEKLRLYLQEYFEKETLALRSQDTKTSQLVSHSVSSSNTHTQFEFRERTLS